MYARNSYFTLRNLETILNSIKGFPAGLQAGGGDPKPCELTVCSARGIVVSVFIAMVQNNRTNGIQRPAGGLMEQNTQYWKFIKKNSLHRI